jgi:hypothetical protein
MKEKLDPYMQPFMMLWDMLPNEKIEDYILKDYSNCHASFYAWKNLDNAFVIWTKRKHDDIPK